MRRPTNTLPLSYRQIVGSSIQTEGYYNAWRTFGEAMVRCRAALLGHGASNADEADRGPDFCNDARPLLSGELGLALLYG
jgi:hypothetical protein